MVLALDTHHMNLWDHYMKRHKNSRLGNLLDIKQQSHIEYLESIGRKDVE